MKKKLNNILDMLPLIFVAIMALSFIGGFITSEFTKLSTVLIIIAGISFLLVLVCFIIDDIKSEKI